MIQAVVDRTASPTWDATDEASAEGREWDHDVAFARDDWDDEPLVRDATGPTVVLVAIPEEHSRGRTEPR